MAYSETSELTLASGAELERIAEVRALLEPELKALAAEGKDFPHVTGDVFFTRCLRGNNGDKDETAKWFRNFLDLRARFGLDAIHAEMEGSRTPWVSTAMPHNKELSKFLNTVFDEAKYRTRHGHLVWYDALGDSRVKRMHEEIGSEKYIKSQQYSCERRTSTLDKLSREEGRMVKIVRVTDFESTGMWMLCKEHMAVDEKHVTPVLLGTSIEVIHLVFYINFPRVFINVWGLLSKLMPPRLIKRFRVLDTDYMQDKEFLSEVGPALMSELLALNRSHNEKDTIDTQALEGSAQFIAPGRVMERVVPVSQGQKVSWAFSVAKGEEVREQRGFFGRIASAVTSMSAGTEVVFSVNAIWTDLDPKVMERVPAKVRSASVEHGDTAEFWVDGKQLDFDAGAGVNIVAMSPRSRELIWSRNYNTVDDTDAASQRMVADLGDLPRASMVLVAVKGTGAEKLTEEALEALAWVGSTMKAGHWHEGYALVGCKGGTRGGLTVAESRGQDTTAEGGVPTMELEAELVAPREVGAESPETCGSTQPFERDGLVMVRWSNYHSFFARKMIKDFKVSVE